MFEFTMQFPSQVKPSEDGSAVALKPKGYWTKDKKKIKGSDFRGPEGANDFHLIFKAFVQFTKNGKKIGPEIPAPKGANDVHVVVEPQSDDNSGRLTGVIQDFGEALEGGDTQEAQVLFAALKQMLHDKGCLE